MLNIKLRVSNLVKRQGTSNPYALAEYHGIKVFALDLPENVRGFYASILRRRFIALNNSLSPTARRVTLCHELGHAMLHRGYGYYYTFNQKFYLSSRREAEANEFAAHLLSYSWDLDQETLLALLKAHKHNPQVVHQILRDMLHAAE